jgi:ABC-type oligopeptide transport system substrate-binding subunit
MTGQPESRIAIALFDGLVEYDEVTSQPRNSLAERIVPNADGSVWTFYLRRNAVWSDGTPLTAHDLVYSWRRALTPSVAAAQASLMYVVTNARAFNEGAAFVRDPRSGKYATEADLQRAGATGPIEFTGSEPETYFDPVLDAAQAAAKPAPSANIENQRHGQPARSEPLITIPGDAKARSHLLAGDPRSHTLPRPELARLIADQELVPVTKENVAIRALDGLTFQVTLTGPTMSFLARVAHPFFRPVPRQTVEKYGDGRWTRFENIVTSGAFRLVEWSPYDQIVVARNPMFWDNANTKLDQIFFVTVEKPATAMNLYKSGEIDCMQSNTVPPAWRKTLSETKRDYRQGPQVKLEAIAFNTTLPVFQDVRVRRAFSLAINREIITDQAPGRVPMSAFVPPMGGYPAATGAGYDPETARRLLAEAGYPNGAGFPELEYLYNTNDSNKQTAELCQQMWLRELNIRINLVNVERRVHLERIRADRIEFHGLAKRPWQADFPDPVSFLELAYSGSANNSTGWHDAKFDGWLEAASREVNNARRSEILHEAEQYMIDQQPLIPLYTEPSAFMCKPYVMNLVPNLLDQHDWRGVYIDHAGSAVAAGR